MSVCPFGLAIAVGQACETALRPEEGWLWCSSQTTADGVAFEVCDALFFASQKGQPKRPATGEAPTSRGGMVK